MQRTRTQPQNQDERTRGFDARLDEARQRLGRIDHVDGEYRLLDGDGTATLVYVEDGVRETVAHLTPSGVAYDHDAQMAHRTAIGCVEAASGSPDYEKITRRLKNLDDVHVESSDGGGSVYCDGSLVAQYGPTPPSNARILLTPPESVRRILHEEGCAVAPYSTRIEMTSAVDTERYGVEIADDDRLMVRRELDGTVLAHVSGDDREMAIQPEAMAIEADHLSHAACALDMQIERLEPTAPAAE